MINRTNWSPSHAQGAPGASNSGGNAGNRNFKKRDSKKNSQPHQKKGTKGDKNPKFHKCNDNYSAVAAVPFTCIVIRDVKCEKKNPHQLYVSHMVRVMKVLGQCFYNMFIITLYYRSSFHKPCAAKN